MFNAMNDDTAPLRFALEHAAVLLSAALDVARGMEYLHAQSPPILHRDLKCLNILCSEGACPCDMCDVMTRDCAHVMT